MITKDDVFMIVHNNPEGAVTHKDGWILRVAKASVRGPNIEEFSHIISNMAAIYTACVINSKGSQQERPKEPPRRAWLKSNASDNAPDDFNMKDVEPDREKSR